MSKINSKKFNLYNESSIATKKKIPIPPPKGSVVQYLLGK
jgi:hypothetical protein